MHLLASLSLSVVEHCVQVVVEPDRRQHMLCACISVLRCLAVLCLGELASQAKLCLKEPFLVVTIQLHIASGACNPH